MRILVISDAWFPQINGVVRTLSTVSEELSAMGHIVGFITPDMFRTLPCPTYPEIRLALARSATIADRIDAFEPSAIHIATEGPLGFAARRYCLARNLPFTTAYHTRFPEYIHARSRLPLALSYSVVRRFHGPATRTMVTTETMRRELAGRGFEHLALWTRGVDVSLFRPRNENHLPGERPIYLYVGRVAVEKNIAAFLDLELEGTKYVVGDGPQRAKLERQHPDVRFVGAKEGEELARHYADADVFVFPSLTDTFGNVLLEALASGVPVAAYPVTGPQDVINGHPVGCLDTDLAAATRSALAIDRRSCRDFAMGFTWRKSAEQFLGNLARFGN